VGVARGYLNRPELTAERFLADRFSAEPGARMYRSGDRGRYLADGNIEFLGRSDFQVKIRGFRIELGEIEAQLAQHPAVREAVVVAREDQAGDQRLVAYYTVKTDTGVVEAEELRRYLAAVLPDYMVPSAYVKLDGLPLTANGKLDRKGLPAPDATAYAARGYAAPVGEIETRLAEIWAEVLGLERVGRHDNFFELGGHSLLAVRVIARLQQEGLQIDLHALFTTATLAALAAVVTGEKPLVAVPPSGIPEGCEEITPQMLPLVNLTRAEIDRIVGAVAGGAANIQDIYPLAPLQEGILFHHLLAKESDPYVLQGMFAFDSRQRLDRYIGALRTVISRHDILRTAVLWEGLAEPVQVVWRNAPLIIEEVVLDPAAGDIAQQLRARFDPRRFRLDVRQAPMMRLSIAQDSENDRWVMLELLHHLSSDHITVEVLQQEIEAHLLGESGRLPAPLPFRNFVAQTRLGVSRAEHESFFRAMLSDVEEPTAPFGLTDVLGDGSGIGESSQAVDADLAKRLRVRARALGISAASLFYLAWAQVLARVSGREEVVFGAVLFGRMQGGQGADRVPGLFMNTLPIRIRIGEDGAADEVRYINGLLAQLLHHEHAPLALAQRCSAVAPPTPLFTALLNYYHTMIPEVGASGEALKAWNGIEYLGGEERTNYPITLSVDDLGDGFTLTAQVCLPLDSARVCDYMHNALDKLVSALESVPEMPVRNLDVMPSAERHQLLVEWNATAAEYPREQCIHELFEAQAARTPEAIAIVHEGAQLTYAELNARANRLAHHLRILGVKPDALVGICVERSLEMIVGLLAILKAGGAYVPLDPSYPAERLAYMLEDSAPVALLTHQQAKPRLSIALEMTRDLQLIDLGADGETWAGQPASDPQRGDIGLTSGHLAYVIYTSGSTGHPKGVMVEHRSLVNLIGWHCKTFHLTGGSRSSTVSSFGFDAAVWETWPALCAGGALLIPTQQIVQDPQALIGWWQKQVLDVSFLPTPLAEFAFIEGIKNQHLNTLLIGGDRLRQLPYPSSLSIINNYGPTETTVVATSGPICTKDSIVTIGRPIANTRIYILDGYGEPVPIGVDGEIYIGGVGVARGYLNRPELTAERFLADRFSAEPGARMYRSGDRGRYLADGNIEFLGRSDFQVKIRGFRIELGEIEAQLTEHPAVREAVVVAREDEAGDQRLVAYYTVKSDAGVVEVEALRRYLAAVLPDYMVPSAYVKLTGLPLTANGKLDRQALPAPDGTAYAARGYAAPVGELETRLAGIWSEVLGLERVGRHDNFFELGGHSLLAVSVAARVERIFGKPLPLAALFQAPKLEQLARILCEKDGSARSSLSVPLVPLQSNGSRSPFFCVHGYGLINARQYVIQGQPLYALIAHGLDGRRAPATIHEMASDYLREIRTIQPSGPYFLGGFSAGGLIAFEMAQQLSVGGRKVALLILFDPSEPETQDFTGPGDSSRCTTKLDVIPSFFSRHLSNLRRFNLKGKCEYLLDRIHGSVRKVEIWFFLRTSGRIPSHLRRLYAFNVARKIVQEYRPQTYPGRVVIFKTGEWSSDWRSAWESLAADGLEVYKISGKHTEIFDDPYFHSWVKYFLTHLDHTSQSNGLDEPGQRS
jgi:amino acid adenylation domain-containing protein